MSRSTLVLGGTRSGKSRFAESLFREFPEVHYLATLDPAGDRDLERRIDIHRARRSAAFSILELEDPIDLPRLISFYSNPLLVDSIGTWVSRLDLADPSGLAALREQLGGAVLSNASELVIVSEEVGLSVHPPSEVGRRFIDEVGLFNQELARVVDRVFMVTAGIAVPIHQFRE